MTDLLTFGKWLLRRPLAIQKCGLVLRGWGGSFPSLYASVGNTIGLLGMFDLVFSLTRGGPGTATQVFATFSYEGAFNSLRWGRGVTVSIFCVPLLIAGIALVSRYLLRDRD